MKVIKRFLLAAILVLLLPLTVNATDDDLKADATISIQETGDVWSGQQVTLNIDLKTTGFSFSNSHFNLPEVSGAFLMQTDTTTVKFSETIDGEAWQIVRYPLALYPQKSGQLEIPPIAVRFMTSTGFGSVEKLFEFQTKALQVTVKSPPGVKDGDMVITTTSFELDYQWQPESGLAKTGDALTLTVKRRANDISAMLLPPLPVFRVDGLASYPQAPEVSDKTNRGDLTGERIDSIIWIVEKPGTYEIPGIRFHWWDPDISELRQQIIPGVNLDIPGSTADRSVANVRDKPEQSGKNVLLLLMLVFAIFAAIFLRLHFGRGKPGHSVDSEKSTFATLQKACRSNDAGTTHSALYDWLVCSAQALLPNSRPRTLSEFARACGDAQLSTELTRLQETLIAPDSNWQGTDLLNSLRRNRRKINKQAIVQSKAHLAPLNP